MLRLALPITIAALLGGCAEPVEPRPPTSLAIQIGTRQSCGFFSGLDYDTACMSAVYVAARAFPSGQVVYERCITLDERAPTLGQLLRGTPLLESGGLSTQGSVTLEVRGLHDVSGGDQCADPANSAAWLLWGESEPVDLAALGEDGGDGGVARIFVDCRDCAFDCAAGDCFGCEALDSGTCPAELPLSFCVPGVSFRCDKRCEDDNDCFEGARRCVGGTCDVREETGALCSPCRLVGDVAEGCIEGFACVGPPGASVGFCAESCPDTFCPDGTRCNRVGNNLITIGE